MSDYAWDRLKADQRALYEFMSEVSERCYCAGWMSGNEFRLWNAISDPSDDLFYGMDYITREECEELKRLHEGCGGWIEWRDDSHNIPHGRWGPYFVPTEVWKYKAIGYREALAAWRKA